VDSIDLDLSLFGLRHVIMKGFSELFGLDLVGYRLTRALKLEVIKLELCKFEEHDIDRHEIEVFDGLGGLGGLGVDKLEAIRLELGGFSGLGVNKLEVVRLEFEGLGVNELEITRLELECATDLVEVLGSRVAHNNLVILIIRSLPNDVH
jgi:hypothetical protein